MKPSHATAAALVAAILAAPAWADTPLSKERETLPGMRSYYVPAAVEAKDKGLSFTLYRTQRATPGDETGRYVLNCESREVVATERGQTTPPFKVLPGEELYVLGKHLCEWDKKGFLDKFLGN